jgi:DNA-binding FrmR family transcriptional regulator
MKKQADTSTKKARGQIDKVIKMLEKEQYCPEIIQQIDAAIGLLKATKRSLLVGHLEHCLESRLKQNKEQTIEELMKIYKLND